MQNIVHKHPLSSQQFHEPLKCDLCGLKGGPNHGICFSCPSCDIDFCEGCFNQLNLCPNNKHDHFLVLERRNYKCDKCGNNYNDKVSIYCSNCDFDVCLNCYITVL